MNPFKQVYEAAIKRGEDESSAIRCAKIHYADYVSYLYGNDYSDEFILERFNEYTRQLAEVISQDL